MGLIMTSSLVVQGNTVELRADGRLENIHDWTAELAEALAKQDGLELSQDHWDVINTMRSYYEEFNTSPILKLLRKELSKKFGPDKASEQHLSELFPNGVQFQGTRLAGLPLAYLDAELESNARIHAVQSAAEKTSDASSIFEFNGQQIPLHSSGNLLNHVDWNEDMAVALAAAEGIELSDEHWVVINYLRKFYFQYGITPMVKVLIKHMSEELGPEAANKEYLYSLFPKGPARQGSRIAGLPSPQGCIDP